MCTAVYAILVFKFASKMNINRSMKKNERKTFKITTPWNAVASAAFEWNLKKKTNVFEFKIHWSNDPYDYVNKSFFIQFSEQQLITRVPCIMLVPVTATRISASLNNFNKFKCKQLAILLTHDDYTTPLHFV